MVSTARSRIALVGLAVVAAVAIVLVVAPWDEPVSRRLALHPCSVGGRAAECGRLAVAEDPGDPAGRKIGLDVVVFRATGDHPKPDPLVWFAGWGSAGATDDAPHVMDAFRRVNADRDVVFIDQRGTGSSRLACDTAPDDEAAPSTAAVTAAARRCVQRIGPNLRHYTTSVAVDDFDAVRRALGYGQINLWIRPTRQATSRTRATSCRTAAR